MIPKHRAWDKSINYMDYRVRVTTIDNDYIKVEVLDAFSDWRELEEEQYELMQSTGLKDKNGVEIFEGDILKGDDGEVFYNSVVFDKEKAIFMRSDSIELWENVEELEVIGNIYENPELLEVENE